MLKMRKSARLVLLAAACAVPTAAGQMVTTNWTLDTAWFAPNDYYATAQGLTGTNLRNQLHLIVEKDYFSSGLDFSTIGNINAHTQHRLNPYSNRGPALDQLDKSAPAVGNFVFNTYDVNLFYTAENRANTSSVAKNAEHVWSASRHNPGSRDDAGRDYTDLYNLRWADAGVNGFKSNANFGGFNGNIGPTQYGYNSTVTPAGTFSLFDPGDAHRGDTARISFYMDVRYDGNTAQDSQTGDLELVEGNPGISVGAQQGSLTEHIKYHFADPVDTFEIRRNHLLFQRTHIDEFNVARTFNWTQGNRNWAVDHPEYVFSIFVGQDNDSTITIAGADVVNADGSSSKDIQLGRVMVGQSAGTLGTVDVTLNKAGTDGTYYEVTTSGGATSSITGRFNAFRHAQTDSTVLTVGVGAVSTAVAGLQGGSVTIDNLDVTTGGGVGNGANDGDDVINVGVAVLQQRVVTADTVDLGTFIVGTTVGGVSDLATSGSDNERTRVNVATTGGAGDVTVVGGAGSLFDAATDTGSRTVEATFATAGAKSGSVGLAVTTAENAGAGLTGEGAYANVAVGYSGTALDPSNASFSSVTDSDVLVIDFGIVGLGSGTASEGFSIYNLESLASFTAALDLDSVTAQPGSDGELTIDTTTFSNLAAGDDVAFSALLATTDIGNFASEYVLSFSDEDIAGETTGLLSTISLSGLVTFFGDVDGDFNVDFDDFNTLLGNFGAMTDLGWQAGDFDGNGVVNFDDFNLLLGNFGVNATPTAAEYAALAAFAASVPEPASLGLFGLAGIGLVRRRK